jgi:hypothetical protein
MEFNLGKETYEGEIIEAKLEDGEYGQQIYIEIAVPNLEWPRKAWYGIKFQKNKEGMVNPRCKFGRLLKNFSNVGKTINSTENLKGIKAEWENQDWVFGKNRETGEDIVARNVPTPIKIIDDLTVTNKQPTTEPSEDKNIEISNEDIEKINKLLEQDFKDYKPVKVVDIISKITKEGYTEEKANEYIDNLLSNGDFYQPKVDSIAKVEQ